MPAAIALTLCTVVLFKMKREHYALVTLVPAVWLVACTTTAGLEKVFSSDPNVGIDLNRRMNETLETMARAIFKDWFVDFGPTRAKIEGSAPYFAPEIWALFPDRLDDEEKPEGWAEKPLDQIAEFLQVMADSPGWAATWVVLATAIPPAYRASGTDKAITDYTRLAGEMTNLRDRFRHAATIDSYKSFAEFDAATKPLLDRS
jgi:hypothetical protein